MGWLGDGFHRGQGCQAWTAVGLPPRYPLITTNSSFKFSCSQYQSVNHYKILLNRTISWPLRNHKTKAFPLVICSRGTCRMDCWSFWSWFDVNRSTIDEDIREKLFVHFSSQWLWPLTFNLLTSNLLPWLLVLSSAMFPLNYEFLRLSYFEKIGGTGRQADGRTECNTKCGP